MVEKLKQLFSVDLRSLALFRVMLALSILLNLAILLPDLSVFLSDSGLYPRRTAMGSSYGWSLYFIHGSSWFALLLMLLNSLAALLLLVGYRTRWMTTLCWVFAMSLDSRIFSLTSGADTYLRLLLFWAMFLPLGARYSVDEAMNKAPAPAAPYFSWAVVGVQVQVASLYLFSALLKTGSHWRETYDAVFYALNSPEITTPLAAYIASYSDLLRGLTLYVYHLELVAVLFLFAPVFTSQARLLIVCLLALMHIGFALFLSIGFFPLVCIAGLMVFLPSLFWDRLPPERRQRIRIYYDEGCGFCRKICLIFRALGMPPATEVLPAQQTAEIREILERENSWVVEDEKGRLLLRWEAVAWCWRRSAILWPLGVLFAIPPMNILGEKLYRFIATHRGDFGILSAKLLPEKDYDSAAPLPVAVSYLMAALVMVVVAWNIATLKGKPQAIFPSLISDTVQLLGLRQKMGFFAPQPISRSRWVVLEGTLADSSKIDLLFRKNQPPQHGVPLHGFQAKPGYRWRKFFSATDIHRQRLLLGRALCRDYAAWKSPDMAPLQSVDLLMYRQTTPAPNATAELVERLWHIRYDCAARSARILTSPPKKAEKTTQTVSDLDAYLDTVLREPGADQ
ncbi:MAG: DCC1-like thiol-disulfide oxidoreductase family protein [Alphaproteobacteria bacterium]|nr:DCC1-like thiol-disulfide oxidoreductase family protein [Alphaproteobacteria bacterium]